MTTDSKREYVRKKCIEANPEIEIWCELCQSHEREIDKMCRKCGRFNTMHHDLSRPIQLADVLLAIGKTDKEIFFNFNHNGLCIRYNDYRTKNGVNKSATWNFLLPLDGQEPSTIAFLAELLG